MKRIACAALAFLMTLCFTACKGGKDINSSDTAGTVTESSGENYTVDGNGNIIDAKTGEAVSNENLSVDSSGNIVDRQTGKVVTSSDKVQSNNSTHTTSNNSSSSKNSSTQSTSSKNNSSSNNSSSQNSNTSNSSSGGNNSSAPSEPEIETTPMSDFDYEPKNDYIMITKYKGENPNVVIPKTAKVFGTQVPIKAIGKRAFERTSAEKVTLLDNFTEVNEYAFAYSPVQEVTLPKTVIKISNHAFRQSSLIKINGGENIREIKSSAFAYCSQLETAEFAKNASVIELSAFRDCTSLKEIKLSNELKIIEGGVFSKCTSLNKVSIGNSLTTIKYNAFAFCSNLHSITLPANFEFFDGDNTFLSSGVYELKFLGNAPKVTYPDKFFNGRIYYKPGTSGWSDTFYGCPTFTW